VKLLFDQNLSPYLVSKLVDLFPHSAHVRDFDLQRADDEHLWRFAIEHGFAIVSKDSDFHQRSFLYGPPPKVSWIQRGNCPTETIELILRERAPDIRYFLDTPEAAFLMLA